MPLQPVNTRTAKIAAARIRGFNNAHMSCRYTTIDNPCAVLIGTVVASRLTFQS